MWELRCLLLVFIEEGIGPAHHQGLSALRFPLRGVPSTPAPISRALLHFLSQCQGIYRINIFSDKMLKGLLTQGRFWFSGKAESIFMEGGYFCGTRLE
jgi:hypothetical protein